MLGIGRMPQEKAPAKTKGAFLHKITQREIGFARVPLGRGTCLAPTPTGKLALMLPPIETVGELDGDG